MFFVDFDIESYINKTLSSVKVPVFNTRADITEENETFITFQELKNESAFNGDNTRYITKFTINLKTFSYGDLFELDRKVEIQMQKAGFTRISKRKSVDIELECNVTMYKFEYVAPTILIEK